MNARLYKVMQGTGEESPLMPEAELFDRARGQAISPETQIFDQAAGRWIKAEEHPALRAIFRQVSPTPTLAPRPSPRPQAATSPPTLPPEAVHHPIAFEEFTRQMVTLYWYFLVGILGLLGGPVGVAILIYAFVLRPALRRRVAELGIHPHLLEEEASRRFWPKARWFIAFIVIVYSVALFFFFRWIRSDPSPSSYSASPTLPPAPPPAPYTGP